MKAKFIYQSLNEKFTDDSDPIDDLNIGKKSNIKDLVNNDIKNLLKDLGYKQTTTASNRYYFDKRDKNYYINIIIDLLDEKGLRFRKYVVGKSFNLEIFVAPYKKYLGIFKEIDFDKEKTIFLKVIDLYKNNTQILDRIILQEIEYIVKDIENKYN
jgi:hypothetical protein